MDSDHSDDDSHLISAAALQSRRTFSFTRQPILHLSPPPPPAENKIKISAAVVNKRSTDLGISLVSTVDLNRENSFSISQSLAFLQRQGNSMGSVDICSLLMGPGRPLVSERSIAAAMRWDGFLPTTPVPPLFVESPNQSSRDATADPSKKRKRQNSNLKIETVPQLCGILQRLLTDLSSL